MILYSVIWTHNSDLAKGKGHCKNKIVGCTCLCRYQSEALRCFIWHFEHRYTERKNFDIDDGEVKISRCKVDSRGFDAHYLMMDKMPEPLDLHSIDKSLYDYSRRYHSR